jgi:hypothetical protein
MLLAGSGWLCQTLLRRSELFGIDDQVISWPIKVRQSGPALKAAVFVESSRRGVW